MDREEALRLLNSKLKNKNLIKHSLAVEACMKKIATQFEGEAINNWGLAGLLHDLDYDMTKDNFSRHGFITAEILEKEAKDIDSEVIEAIKAHTGHIERKSKMAKALYCIDPLTGLIISACLMHPDKRLQSVETKFVLNRFKEKSFAKGANRGQIKTCEELGFSLEDFITLCLEAMKEISHELEL
jgi:putative nucleotidyltransferase with HDIG domain